MRARLGSSWAAPTALALLVAFAPTGAYPQAKADTKRSRLPAAVLTAIDTNCPGAEIDKLEIDDEGGIKVFDLEFKADRGEIDVAEDGTVLDVATVVQLQDVPEPAAAVIRKAAGSKGVRRVEKSEVRSRIEKQDGKGRLVPIAPPELEYEAELAKGGEIEVAADGRVIKGPKPEGQESKDKK